MSNQAKLCRSIYSRIEQFQSYSIFQIRNTLVVALSMHPWLPTSVFRTRLMPASELIQCIYGPSHPN